MTDRLAARRAAAATLAWPAAIAAVTLVALVAGLVGDGGWDRLAAAGLAIPVVASARGLLPRRAARGTPAQTGRR